MATQELPLPAHFDPARVSQIWRVPYQQRADDAEQWARQHAIADASRDRQRVLLLLVDVQNTFCIPGFELFVAGASGTAAVEDNRRLCEFIYRNLQCISQVCITLDTHLAMQIFHSVFWVDPRGEHPPPLTTILPEEVAAGRWRINPAVAPNLGIEEEYGNRYLKFYTEQLQKGGKYDLTIWPYHAMQGGIGHALVPAVEEAVFFHCIARSIAPHFQIKGENPLTESYSVLQPEIQQDMAGRPLTSKHSDLIESVVNADACIVAGQAKSHCLAWTMSDLLNEINARDPGIARKIYLLEDCTSPVVVPGVVDYTAAADAAFRRFARAGMQVVRSTDPLAFWPGPLGSA